MTRPLLALVAALALSPAARADMKTVTLKNITPAALAGMLADETTLLLPDGVDTITLDVKSKSVLFTGTKDGLAQVASLVAMLDKPAKVVNVALKLIRGGKTVATPTVRAISNKRTALKSAGLYNLEIFTHVNGDGSISLDIETATEKTTKRVAPGAPTKFTFKYTTVVATATIAR